MTKLLVDTGALVALLDRRDRYHPWVKGVIAHVRSAALTCEAVLSETSFLLRRLRGADQAIQGLLELVQRGLLTVPFRIEEEAARVAKLLARYGSVPMSFADACLVRMAEQHAGSRVLTLDADFHIYRKNGREVVPTVTPH